MEKVPYRPIGLVKAALETLGFEISHCYEDLIFLNHNAFLLRMEQRGEEVSLLFNSEADEDSRDELSASLANAGKEFHLNIARAGTYTIVPNDENETLDIHFSD